MAPKASARTKPERTLFRLILVILLFAMVFLFMGGDFAGIDGSSMEPTLNQDDGLWVEGLSYLQGKPRRGDIVLIEMGMGRGLVKRVIGLPGETLAIEDGLVYLNGVGLLEPYLAEPAGGEFGPVLIPSGHYFVLGDNRNYSSDNPLPRGHQDLAARIVTDLGASPIRGSADRSGPIAIARAQKVLKIPFSCELVD